MGVNEGDAVLVGRGVPVMARVGRWVGPGTISVRAGRDVAVPLARARLAVAGLRTTTAVAVAGCVGV
jgi:hypothetical protein